MKKLLPLFLFLLIGCNSIDPILEYQQKLISDEVTGSNIFKLVKNGEVVYKEVANSKTKTLMMKLFFLFGLCRNL